MSLSSPFRFQHQATQNERAASGLVHAGFASTRDAEARQTFGFDFLEAQALGNSVHVPGASGDIVKHVDFLRARKERRADQAASGIDPHATYEDDGLLHRDGQGEAAIDFDDRAMREMVRTAFAYGLEVVGEEDQFRKMPDARARRGEHVRVLLEEGKRFAVVDPLDGSNQAAGRGQRSGWACCAFIVDPSVSVLTAAVLLGDGRGVVTAGNNGVWLSESHHPDRPAVAYQLSQSHRDRPPFERPHWVLPAAKEGRLEHALAVVDASRGDGGEAHVSWISPLGGNPGFVAGLLCAGAVAGVQPESDAWDQMGPYLCAVAGLPTISAASPDPLTPEEISEMLLRDLMAGRKTQALYSGRSLQDARYLREVDIMATAELRRRKSARNQ